MDIEERRVGALTIQVDRNLCVGFADCTQVAPEAFELDAEGIATLRAEAAGVDAETLLEACRACPVDALCAFDEDGDQLV